jgi:ribose-phosphate pyrophosphokinase
MISLYSSTRTNIKLKQWIFPGGEVGIKIDEESIYVSDDYFIRIDKIPSSDDIMMAINIADALQRLGVYNIVLDVPYLPYARQDRVCHPGESFALEVFIKILSASAITRICTADLHSSVSVDLIRKNKFILTEINQDWCSDNLPYHDVLIAPDKGAESKIVLYDKADSIVCLSKTRKNYGVIYDDYPFDTIKGNVCVVDDIFDGGATFLSLGNMLKRTQPNITNMNLYVTHGLFSNLVKFAECKQLFDTIYVYNLMNDSVKDSVVVL